jgi:hypothetical protein
MQLRSVAELRQLARDCLTVHGDGAWNIFRAAAGNDGPHSRYGAKCVKIFEAERFALHTDPNTYKPGKREAARMREMMSIPADHPLPVVINATCDAVLTIKPDAEITRTKHGLRISGDGMELSRVH